MKRLGFWGIIKLTTHILLRNLHHFLCITLLLALSDALNFIVMDPFYFGKALQHFGASVSILYKVISSQAGDSDPSNLTPAEKSLIAYQQQHSPARFSLLLVATLSSSISLLCTIPVTFSVCRACLNKSVDLKGALLRGVPRSAKNLVLTWMVEFGLVVLFVFVGTLGMTILAAGLSAVEANVGIPITIMAIGVVGGGLYMVVIFSLGTTVAILEEKKGWEAISKSAHLIKGSTWIVVGLKSALYGVTTIVGLCLTPSEEASVVWKWVAGGLSVGLQAFIVLYTMISTVVLYMSCKNGKEEPVETLLAASSEFGPGDWAPKYLDLETAAFATNTQ